MVVHHSLCLTEAVRSPLCIAMRGDGHSYWLEGRNNNPPISAMEARRQRRNLVKALMLYADALPRAEGLAQRLRTCSWSQPCTSGGCPVCWRAMRRLVVHASRYLFRENDHFEYVTCIHADDMVRQGRLAEAQPLAAAERRLITIAQRTRTRVFGGLDVSVNEHEHHAFEPHYMPHPHVLVPAEAFARDRDAWNREYPIGSLVKVPVLSKPYDGGRRAIAYSLRPIVERRDSLAPRLAPDGRQRRADTRTGKPVRRRERVELALMLDRAGIEARVIMYGYEMVTDGYDIWIDPVERGRADELLSERRRIQDAREIARQQQERCDRRQPPRFRL